MGDDVELTTIPAAFNATAMKYPDAEAVVFGATRLTYLELADRVRLAARALLASGVSKRDRVAVWAPNSDQWVVMALAIVSTGAIVIPVNTRLKGAEARYILEASRASLVFIDDGFLNLALIDMLREGSEAPSLTSPVSLLPELKEIVVFAASPASHVTTFDQFLARAERVAGSILDEAVASVVPSDVSDIIFTSGTTGRPKGAELLHGQTVRLYTYWSDTVGLQPGDRFLGVNPFFHCFGYKAGLLASLMRGATLLPVSVFDAVNTMALIEAENINIAPGTPTLYISLLDHPRRGEFDLSSLRVAVTGGSVVPTALIRRMRGDLGFRTVINAYGLTESCGFATSCHADDSDEIIANTSGRAVEGTEVVISSVNGELLGPGEPGEVLVRGYNVMAGYFENPEATARTIDSQGWLHTGDIGVLDEDGNLKITDRTKDMYVVGGYNTYPAEIEQVIMHHEAVSEVAVIGVADDRMGEVGLAYVVLRPHAELTDRDLIEYCRERMANYKVPRFVQVVPSLPRNGSGKVDKLTLRKNAASDVG